MLEEFPGLMEGDGNINRKYTANRSMINARTEVQFVQSTMGCSQGAEKLSGSASSRNNRLNMPFYIPVECVGSWHLQRK